MATFRKKRLRPVEGLLPLALLIKLVLSVVQVIAGAFSSSLSLMADALHNLTDAGSMLVAWVARRISRKAADKTMTFGYHRAEIVGVLINSTSLIAIGLFLIFQSVNRFFHPAEVDGSIVLWVAAVSALTGFIVTLLTYHAGAAESMGIKAVFIHNLADTLAAIAVFMAGAIMLFSGFYLIDAIISLAISVYVIYQGLFLLKKSILIIMQAVPAGICVEKIRDAIESIEQVRGLKNLHVWQLDEHNLYFEGFVELSVPEAESVKETIRRMLDQQFAIRNCVIETIYRQDGVALL